MAGNIKGITIEFKGDTTQLGKALSSVNKEIKATDSALREVDKALKLDPGNVELLAQKEALLAKQIEQTRDKLELQKRAAQEAGQALKDGTISQEEYAKLTAEVTKTADKLSKLETEATGAGDSLEDAGQAAADAGDEVKASGEDAEKSGDGWRKFGEAAAAAAAAAVAAITAVTGAMIEVTTSLANFSIAGGDFADEINTLSKTTHISTQSLQEYQYAAELLDVSVGTMTGSITKLEKAMASAEGGSKSSIVAFEKLGVSYLNADGSFRNAEDTFFDVIDALGRIDNEVERDTLAMSILGKSAKELNPLIVEGSDSLKKYASEAAAAGYVLDQNTLDAFQALDDNMVRLENGSTALSNALGTILLPTLTDLSGEGVDLLGEFTNAILGTGGDIDQFGAIIDDFAPKISDLIGRYLPKFAEMAAKIISVVAQGIGRNIKPILEAVKTVLTTVISTLGEVLPMLLNTVLEILLAVANVLLAPENIVSIINAIVQIVVNVANALVDALPNLIPAVIDGILLIASTILDPENLKAIMTAALSIIEAVSDGILSALPDLIPTILNIIETVVTTILEPNNLQKVLRAAIQIIVAVVNGIAEALPQLIPAIAEAITVINETLLDPELLSLIIDSGVNLIVKLIEGIIAAAPDLIEAVGGVGLQVLEKLGEWASDIAEAAAIWAADMMQSFINGIKNKLSDLGDAAASIGQTVKDFIGFSEPKYGPLSNFHTFAPDMIDLYTKGINDNINKVEASMDIMAGVVAGDVTGAVPNYSGDLSRINDSITNLGGTMDKPIALTVYIGDEQIQNVVVNAVNKFDYLSAGR